MKQSHTMLDDFPIRSSKDWKFGLVTREIYRINETFFEINEMSDGWVTTIVDLDTLQKLINGKKSITSLNWQ